MSTKIEKLNGTNFYAWKQKIKHLLALKDLDDLVDGSPPAEGETEAVHKDWKRRDIKAQAIIGLTLSDEMLANTREVQTTKQMWKKICDVFERHTLLNKLSARRKFYTATLQEGESILQFANRIRLLAATLKSMKVLIDESEVAMAMLNGLPEAYDPLISAIDAISGEDDKLQFDYVKSRIIQEEQRINARTSQAASKAEAAALLSKDTTPPDRRPTCAHCNKKGHKEARCWKKHPHLNPHKNGHGALVASRQGQEDPSVVCLVAKHSVYAAQVEENPEIEWIVDSGCSAHMTHDKSLFLSYAPVAGSQYVELGDNKKVEIVGQGTVRIQLKVKGKQSTCNLHNAMHVPDLGYSLLSVPSMDKNGLFTTFGNKMCYVRNKKQRLVATATMVGNLYKLDTGPRVSMQPPALIAQEVGLWHRRLAHIHPSSIEQMAADGSVSGINLSKNQNTEYSCDHCVIGKGHRQPFPKKSASHSKRLLELVHSDVVGPMEVPSLGGSLYFITFIDDFSKWTTVYTMKKKSGALPCFIKFHKMAEKHTGNKLLKVNIIRRKPGTIDQIKVLRTDNGGEYVSNKFKSYLEEHGIVHQTTIAYTPQQNGVAERMNRTLIDLVRSMLHDANLDKKFWAEALNTAVYIRNRVVSSSLPQRSTPHHQWFGSTPDLSHCRVFGSKCLYVLPKTKLRKLDPRSHEARFLGYLENTKGYKLWDVETGRCAISRDVTFRESDGIAEHTLSSGKNQESPSDTLNRGGEQELRFQSAKDEVAEQAQGADEPEEAGQEKSSEEHDAINDPSQDEQPQNDPESNHDEDMHDCQEDENAGPESQETGDAESNPPLRRSKRPKRKPNWWKPSVNIALSARVIPVSYKKATLPDNIDFWKPGIDKEHDCLLRNKTWTIVKRKPSMHVLPSKYVFRVKNGGPKARVVALGCHQLFGIDYLETFAPVVKLTTIRTLLALVAMFDLECEQMDVITAFLNGDLDQEIYMLIPEGLRTPENEGMVCKLQKSLYGLKQSPRQWYAKIHDFLVGTLKFIASLNDPCLYVRKSESKILIIALYVDDLLIVGNCKSEITDIKGELSKRFEMKDLGPASVMLGIEIKRVRKDRKLWITQQDYTLEVLKRFRMTDCRTVSTPMDKSTLATLDSDGDEASENIPYRQAIGSLIYLVTCTRPDLAFTVHRLSQYLEKPKDHHWSAVKRALRYLWTTRNYGILYDGRRGSSLVGYADSDYAGDIETRKSTSGYVFLMAGGAVSWKSKKQSVVATSSCEAEYVASCLAAKEAVWLGRLLHDLTIKSEPYAITIKVDNNGAKDLAYNATVNERTKHIDVQFHFVRECTFRKKIELIRCDTTNQVADPLTKPLDRQQHQKLCSMQGLQDSRSS